MALTLAAMRRGTLSARACWLVAARYAFPVGVAFATAFTGGRPPALEHTLPGRLCGVVQAGLLGSALAPPRLQPRDQSPRLLLALTTVLSVASGGAQVRRLRRLPRARSGSADR